MPSHEYSPAEALALVLGAIRKANPDLAARIEVAINEGKEVKVQVEQPSKGRGRKVLRSYRKTEPFSDDEALGVALDVLKAHLLETRMFARSAHGDFFVVELAPPKSMSLALEGGHVGELQGKNSEKPIEVDLEPETIQAKKKVPNHRLKAEKDADIDSLRQVFDRLSKLLDFSPEI